MTEGHKHRMLKVKEGGLVERLLTGPVLRRSTDRGLVDRSGMVWHCEPEDLETGPYLLRPLGLLHGLSGLTLDTQEHGVASRALDRFYSTWRSAEAAGDSDLTHGQWGDYKAWHVVHGWYVTPGDWSLGISLTNDLAKDPDYASEGGRIAFGVEVGPFGWHISLNQPYVERARGPMFQGVVVDEMRMSHEPSATVSPSGGG